MNEKLDHIVWRSLSGAHRHLSVGTDEVRRYAPGFSPIVGFNPNVVADLDALANFCEPGESFYTDNWTGPLPANWRLELESTMLKMVWKGNIDSVMAHEPNQPVVPLEAKHAEAAVDLAKLTNPGPFGLRTSELGEYFGVFDGPRLIAMAGERFHAPPYREISGVCTHPDYQGNGLGKTLIRHVLRRQSDRGDQPFLHVMSANELARALYRRLGFHDYLETVVRVVTKL